MKATHAPETTIAQGLAELNVNPLDGSAFKSRDPEQLVDDRSALREVSAQPAEFQPIVSFSHGTLESRVVGPSGAYEFRFCLKESEGSMAQQHVLDPLRSLVVIDPQFGELARDARNALSESDQRLVDKLLIKHPNLQILNYDGHLTFFSQDVNLAVAELMLTESSHRTSPCSDVSVLFFQRDEGALVSSTKFISVGTYSELMDVSGENSGSFWEKPEWKQEALGMGLSSDKINEIQRDMNRRYGAESNAVTGAASIWSWLSSFRFW